MKQKIKALIFDVGGVLFLVKNKKKRKSKNLLSSFKEACLLLKGIDINLNEVYDFLKEIYIKSSRGEFSKKQTLKLLSNELGISIEKTEKAFKDVYKKNTIENKKLYSYIIKLKRKGYKIGILSIQFHLSKSILIPKKYYKNFDALEISCDDKLRKPDEKAFKLILKRLNVKPEESVFVDDKQENLNAAEKLGMKTALFESNKQFFKQLKKLNILLPLKK